MAGKDVADWFKGAIAHARDTLHTVAKSPTGRQIISQVESEALKTLRAMAEAELTSRGVPLTPVISAVEDAAESGIKGAVTKALDK